MFFRRGFSLSLGLSCRCASTQLSKPHVVETFARSFTRMQYSSLSVLHGYFHSASNFRTSSLQILPRPKLHLINELISVQPLLFTGLQCRSFAKVKKAKGKKSQSPKVSLDMELAEGVVDSQNLIDSMDNIVSRFRDTLSKKITTRISSGMFDDILIDTGSGKVKLFNIASIKTDQKFFSITVISDFPNACQKVQEGIKAAGYQLSMQTSDDSVLIQIPVVTKEYKEQLKKIAKGFLEQSKAQIRKVRQQGMTDLRKNKDLVSKDESRALEKQIQGLHDNAIAKLEDLLSSKNKELGN